MKLKNTYKTPIFGTESNCIQGYTTIITFQNFNSKEQLIPLTVEVCPIYHLIKIFTNTTQQTCQFLNISLTLVKFFLPFFICFLQLFEQETSQKNSNQALQREHDIDINTIIRARSLQHP